MTVAYVESNFVLEIALGQEEAESALLMLEAAEQGHYSLVLPSLALFEPYSTVAIRGRERRRIAGTLGEQTRQLQRSRQHDIAVSQMLETYETLIAMERLEFNELQSALLRIVQSSTQLELGTESLIKAAEYRLKFGLSDQDALVLASVVLDLATRTPAEVKVFVDRNRADFGKPDVIAELASYGCTFFESFASGWNVISGMT